MENKSDTFKALTKLLNILFVKKYPTVFSKVEILNMEEYKTEIVVNIAIYVTKHITIKAFESQDEYEADYIYDDIGEFTSDDEGQFAEIVSEMLDIDMYDELSSILSYVIVHKHGIPNYELKPDFDLEDDTD